MTVEPMPMPAPLAALNGRLADALWPGASHKTPLQVAFSALALRLLPQARVYQLVEALPCAAAPFELADLRSAMSHLGFNAVCVATAPAQLDMGQMPCLFMPHGGKGLYALLGATPEGQGIDAIECNTEQEITIDIESDLLNKNGTAWVFTQQHGAGDMLPPATALGWLGKQVARFKPYGGLLLGLGLGVNLLELVLPLFVFEVYSRVIAGGVAHALVWLAPGLLLALGFEWWLCRLRSALLGMLDVRFSSQLSRAAFAGLLRLPPAEARAACLKDIEAARGTFSGPLFQTLVDLPYTFIAGVAIVVVAGPLVLVPVAMGLLYAAACALLYRHARKVMGAAAQARALHRQFTLDTFAQREAIRLGRLGRIWREKYRELSAGVCHAQYRQMMAHALSESLAYGITLLNAALVLGCGALMVRHGTLTPAALLAVMMLAWGMLSPLYSLGALLLRLEQLAGAVAQRHTPVELAEAADEPARQRLNRLHGAVTLQDVTLAPHPEAPLFKGLSLNIQPGQLVAVCGVAGSGKSLLLAALQGLVKPAEGTLQLDGCDLEQLDMADVRRQMAYIPQTLDLFPGTVADNLRLPRHEATDTALWQALELAGAADAVRALSSQLQAPVEGLENALAWQIIVARAFVHNAPLLLVDELPETTPAYRHLLHAIGRMRGRHTVIMVSREEGACAVADQVIVLRGREAPRAGVSKQRGPALHKNPK